MAPAKKKLRLSNGAAQAAQEEETTSNSAPIAESAPPSTADSKTKPESAEQQRRSIFVRSLPASATSDSLTELFSEHFPVKHATAVTDPATKECKGYGFVTFADAEDAARAKTQFNNHVLDGRKLRVEIAEPRQRDGEDKGVKSARIEKEQQQQQPPKLIVRNLPWSIKGSEQLTKLFMSYGKVKQAYVPKKGPGLLSGFGFVIMRGRKNAEKAIEGVNGKEIDGRTLAVDWAVEKDVFTGANTEVNDTETEEAAGGEAQRGSEADVVERLGDDDDDDEQMILRDDDDEESDEADGDEEDEEDEIDAEDGGVDLSGDEGPESPRRQFSEDRSSTLFVRNLPFTCTDEDLEDHFSQFGSTRYARVVMDQSTERSKGTGFVCFYNTEDADMCLREAPQRTQAVALGKAGKETGPIQQTHSILQNEFADPAGKFTLDGRVLQITRAVNKSEATRLTEEGVAHRFRRDTDKRRLFLLSEGSISSKSKLWESLAPSERAMRDASSKQRKTLIESNPSLHLSLTRLSIRNIPRSVTSKELKDLARAAVVGFATDVKGGLRQRLSREEIARGGDDMVEAEKARKRAGKGIVKQAKVVFEGSTGSKVREDSGAGRSRGYGFIEYYTHRNALMGLRWLNGHAVDYKVKDTGKGSKKSGLSREDIQDRKKRLIVEFAIENAQVVLRRTDREQKARDRSQHAQKHANDEQDEDVATEAGASGDKAGSRKRKRSAAPGADAKRQIAKPDGSTKSPVDEKLARRNHIIGKKRAMRKAKKGSKA